MRFKLKKVCIYTCILQMIIGYTCFVIYSQRISNEPTIVLVQNLPTKGISLVQRTEKQRVSVNANPVNKSITCPLELARNNTWQLVDNAKHVLVFSAYFMGGSGNIVVISARYRHLPFKDYTCQLWLRNETSQHVYMVESAATAKDQTEHHGRSYTSSLITCANHLGMMPDYVSIVRAQGTKPTNLIQVRPAVKPATYKHRFTVCLSPLNFNYGRAFELVEWIELNRLLGADVFTIYNYSSAWNVQRVLQYYSERGIAEVVDWKLPLNLVTNDPNIKTDIHYYGQVVQLQECLYRNKHSSEFIVNLDLDEFIIPHKQNVNTWSKMLLPFSKTAGAYIFRNTFYKKEWNDTNSEYKNKQLAVKYKLITLLKTKHETKISAHRHRSKYFARTSAVDRLMIHDVPGLGGSTKPEMVPKETALLHHYRNWFQSGEPETVKVEDDAVVRKYSNDLIANVDTVWKALPNVVLDNSPNQHVG